MLQSHERRRALAHPEAPSTSLLTRLMNPPTLPLRPIALVYLVRLRNLPPLLLPDPPAFRPRYNTLYALVLACDPSTLGFLLLTFSHRPSCLLSPRFCSSGGPRQSLDSTASSSHGRYLTPDHPFVGGVGTWRERGDESKGGRTG